VFLVTATITFLSLPTIQVDSLIKSGAPRMGIFSQYLTLTVVRQLASPLSHTPGRRQE
jgi:hypothetical protein